MSVDESRENYIKRLHGLNQDGEDDEEQPERTRTRGEPKKAPNEAPKEDGPHYGNTRLPYGLAIEAGIDTTGLKPHEVWELLKNGTGVTHGEVMKQLKETGTVQDVAEKISENAPKNTPSDTPNNTPQEPPKSEPKQETPPSAPQETSQTTSENSLKNDPNYKYWTPDMKLHEETYNKLKKLSGVLHNLHSSDKPFWEANLAQDYINPTQLKDAIDKEYSGADLNTPERDYYRDLYDEACSFGSCGQLVANLTTIGNACKEIQKLSENRNTDPDYLSKIKACFRTIRRVRESPSFEMSCYRAFGEHLAGENGMKLWLKINRDIDNAIDDAQDDCDDYERALGLFDGMFDLDTLDTNDISHGVDNLKNSWFAKRFPEDTRKITEGLGEFQKTIGDLTGNIKKIYESDDDPETKKKNLAEYRNHIWDVRNDLVDGKTKLANDSPLYRQSLLRALDKLTNVCTMKHMDSMNGPQPNYASMERGKYDKLKISKENTVEGAYIKFDPDSFSEDRKHYAVWCMTVNDSVKRFGEWTQGIFRNTPKDQRKSVWAYTAGSGHCNRPLSGYFYDGPEKANPEEKWDMSYYAGVGNGDLNIEGGKKDIDNVTEFLKNSRLERDTWVQRGVDPNGAKALFGLNELTEESLNGLVSTGRVFQQKSFMSCGAAKDSGFKDEAVVLNIYCPKGTQAGYIAPISAFGGDPSYKGGKISLSGKENEMLIQRNSVMRATKVTRSDDGKRFYVDVEIVAQAPYDYDKE